jgi:hypothetical protein
MMRLLAGVAFVVTVLAPVAAWAGNAPLDRAAQLANVCKGGPNKGQPCCPNVEAGADEDSVDDPCPNGDCVLVKGKQFNAKVTLIADDDVRDLAGNTLRAGDQNVRVVAVTVVMELKAKVVLANTYQELCAIDPFDERVCSGNRTLEELVRSLANGPRFFAPGGGFAVSLNEQGLFDNFAGGASFSLLSRRVAFGFEQALRTQFEMTGNEMPVITGIRAGTINDRRGDDLASIVRLKVAFAFLEPNAIDCPQ